MSDLNKAVSMNYEAECKRLSEIMGRMELQHHEERDSLKRRIAELEHDLMIYEQKWSVIQLIFGR